MNQTAATKRGKGSCPECMAEYFCRYKPNKCTQCGHFLGGSHVPSKKTKLDVPKASIIINTKDLKMYSVKTSTHDDRCLVIEQGGTRLCHHSLCLEKRAVYLNSQRAAQFTCEHLELLKEDINHPTIVKDTIDPQQLAGYSCGEVISDHLKELSNSSGHFPLAVKVSPSMFCVFGEADASNPMGYCHVRVGEKMIKCTSKSCKSFVSKGKQQKARKICLHLHVLFCLRLCSFQDLPPVPVSETEHISTDTQMQNSARHKTIDIRMDIVNFPCVIPSEIIRRDQFISWPDRLEPTDLQCCACDTPLGESVKHPGTRGVSYLIADQCPFKHVTVLVKICPQCGVMHQSFPFNQGLFNISDKVIVTLDILLQWRYLFKRGVSISIAIDSKLEALQEKAKTPPTGNELLNISRHLYNGFYAFEISTERDLNSVICGICGTASEVYFGDGNEKNCCELSEIDYKVDENEQTSEPMELETFLNLLKRRLIECTTYTRCDMPFQIRLAQIPPIIPPALRGGHVVNTEQLKKSTVRKQLNTSTPEGDPALLHKLITDKKLDMEKLGELDSELLKKVCQDCNIVSTNKSQAGMRLALQCLYETLLVGSCPCHGFTKVPNHTGGFYHFVCRHGVTAASKFLTLQESVRDPADLYLSLRVPPLTFICDTPCGLVRHMDCRVPETTEVLWGEYRGCFEKPSLDKTPCDNIDIAMMTVAEFRDSDNKPIDSPDTLAHPLTGSTRRYMLGDRFHTGSNPHKSPLCHYHNINLLNQSNTIKTSYQESENSRKNSRRLRSSCMQNFSTHFLYNFLMDFYQNEMIVKKQRNNIEKSLDKSLNINRNLFMQFNINSDV